MIQACYFHILFVLIFICLRTNSCVDLNLRCTLEVGLSSLNVNHFHRKREDLTLIVEARLGNLHGALVHRKKLLADLEMGEQCRLWVPYESLLCFLYW